MCILKENGNISLGLMFNKALKNNASKGHICCEVE